MRSSGWLTFVTMLESLNKLGLASLKANSYGTANVDEFRYLYNHGLEKYYQTVRQVHMLTALQIQAELDFKIEVKIAVPDEYVEESTTDYHPTQSHQSSPDQEPVEQKGTCQYPSSFQVDSS